MHQLIILPEAGASGPELWVVILVVNGNFTRRNEMSDDLPPSGKLINEMLEKSGINDALNDINKAEVDRQFNSGRTPYKMQSSQERFGYFVSDSIADFWRLAFWWVPK
jgi:hypothetical protein